MKKIVSKIWQWLTFLFMGIVIGMYFFFEIAKKSINNQNFNIKKIKQKGDDNNADLHINNHQQQSQLEKKEKHRKKIRLFRRRKK